MSERDDDEAASWQRKRRQFHSKSKAPSGRVAPLSDQLSPRSERKTSVPSSMQPSLRYTRQAPRLSSRPSSVVVPEVPPPRSPTPEATSSGMPEVVDYVPEMPPARPPTPDVTSRGTQAVRPVREVMVQTTPRQEPEPAVVQAPPVVPLEALPRKKDTDRLLQGLAQQTEQTQENKRSLRRLKEAQQEMADKMATIIEATTNSASRQVELIETVQNYRQQQADVEEKQQKKLRQLNEKLDTMSQKLELLDRPSEQLVRSLQMTQDLTVQIAQLNEGLLLMRQAQEDLYERVEEVRGHTIEAKESSARAFSAKGSVIADAGECYCGGKGSCLRCENDAAGRRFLESNNLPSRDPDVVKRLGQMLSCVYKDDGPGLYANIERFKEEVAAKWNPDQVRNAFNALFQTAMMRDSSRATSILADSFDLTGGDNTARTGKSLGRKNLSDFLRMAVKSRRVSVANMILKKMQQHLGKDALNMGLVSGASSSPKYLLFDCVREGDASMFKCLVTAGADLETREAGGSSILHELALQSAIETKEDAVLDMMDVLYQSAGHWWRRSRKERVSPLHQDDSDDTCQALHYLFSLRDSQGLNGIQGTARFGSARLLAKMVSNPPYHFVTEPETFGADYDKKAYVVDDIDGDLAPAGTSVLESIVEREMSVAKDMVEIEPFCTMFNDKWERYKIFYWMWFLLYIVYISVYSACAVNRRVAPVQQWVDLYTLPVDRLRAAGEILCLLSLPLFFFGEFKDVRRNGWRLRRADARVNAFRLANLAFVVSVVLSFILRQVQSPVEDVFLCAALLVGWSMSTQFLVPTLKAGMFPIVLYRVFMYDFLYRYVWIFALLLVGSTAATFAAYQGAVEFHSEVPKDSFFGALLGMVKLTFGLVDVDYVTEARLPAMGVILFLVYIWLGHVLLLNLLIAMVNDTYSLTRKEQKRAWMHTKAWFALLMDRRLPAAARVPYDCYSHAAGEVSLFGRFGYMKLFSQTSLMYIHNRRRRYIGGSDPPDEHLVLMN